MNETGEPSSIEEQIALLRGLHLHEPADVFERELKRRDAIAARNKEAYATLRTRAQALRDENEKLKREDTGRVLRSDSYIGMKGEVVLRIEPEKRGSVHVRIQGQGVEMAAVSHRGETLDKGEITVVVDVKDAVLHVARPRPSESSER